MDTTKQKGIKILASILCLFVSFTAVIGINVSEQNSLWGVGPAPVISTILKTIILFIIFSIILFLIIPSARSRNTPLLPDSKIFDLKFLFFFVIIIDTALAIVFYPCTQNWDTYTQLRDYFDGTTVINYTLGNNYEVLCSLNDHHPIVTTLLFGSFAQLGRLLGNEPLGSFLFIELQIFVFAFVFVLAVRYIESIDKNAAKYASLFYMLYPLLAYYAITMVKDSTYSILFLAYYILYIQLYNGNKSKCLLICFFLLSIILPLTKKTAIYILMVSNLPLIIHSLRNRDGWRRIMMTVGSVIIPCLVMFLILPSIVFPAFQIFPGGKQEVYGTLFQQTARVKCYYPNAYNENEANIIRKVIDYDHLEILYQQNITDPVKKTYRLATVNDEDFHDYLSVWFHKGLHYPKAYIESLIGTCFGYFAPGSGEYVFLENHTYPFPEQGKRSAIQSLITSFHSWFENLPGINLLFQLVLFTWWIPVYVFYEILRKRKWTDVFQLLPVFMTQLTLIVSPLSYSRYALCLVMITPLYYAMIHSTDNTKSQKKML